MTYYAQDIQKKKREIFVDKICFKRAPYIFCYKDGVGFIFQGSCNNWQCPRCGEIRAKQEYARMVRGCEKLESEGHDLYFWTLTCRGRELEKHDAVASYYKWTTRLLNACRNSCNRSNEFWCYVQVTERQKRGHPHSHLITTWLPSDAVAVDIVKSGKKRSVLKSNWFVRRNISAGLGNQCEITRVKSARGVSSYVAKYLFKDAISTEWPKGWRRIRYSRSFPRFETANDFDGGFPLLSRDDWVNACDIVTKIETNCLDVVTNLSRYAVEVVTYTGNDLEF